MTVISKETYEAFLINDNEEEVLAEWIDPSKYKKGNYVVKDSEGKITEYTPEDFKKKFDPLASGDSVVLKAYNEDKLIEEKTFNYNTLRFYSNMRDFINKYKQYNFDKKGYCSKIEMYMNDNYMKTWEFRDSGYFVDMGHFC